jgi:hypothetical protein
MDKLYGVYNDQFWVMDRLPYNPNHQKPDRSHKVIIPLGISHHTLAEDSS